MLQGLNLTQHKPLLIQKSSPLILHIFSIGISSTGQTVIPLSYSCFTMEIIWAFESPDFGKSQWLELMRAPISVSIPQAASRSGVAPTCDHSGTVIFVSEPTRATVSLLRMNPNFGIGTSGVEPNHMSRCKFLGMGMAGASGPPGSPGGPVFTVCNFPILPFLTNSAAILKTRHLALCCVPT